MTKQSATFDYLSYQTNCQFEDIEMAINNIVFASDKQFDEIKKEKWYTRLFNCVTFSQKSKKRMAEQISSLSQAQQILMEILVRLSAQEAKVALYINQNIQSIRKLTENDIYLQDQISQLETSLIFGIKKIDDIRKLTLNEKEVLYACLSKLSKLIHYPSEEQQAYADNVCCYMDVEAEVENVENKLSNIDVPSRKIMITCCLEYLYLYELNFDFNDKVSDFINEFDLGNITITSIKNRIINTYDLRGEDGLINKYNWDFDDSITRDFLVDCDENDFIDETDNSINDTENNIKIESYKGIPFKIADEIFKAASLNEFTNTIREPNFFETKDYYVWDTESYSYSQSKYMCYCKLTDTKKEIKAVNLFNCEISFRSREKLITVDYDNNYAYYIVKNSLFKLDISYDKETKITDLPINNDASFIRYSNNLLLIGLYDKSTSNTRITYYDFEKKIFGKLKDAAGKSICGKQDNVTICERKIVFYNYRNDRLIADDGASFENCICSYDINSKQIIRLYDFNECVTLLKFFVINNEIYFIMYGDSYDNIALYKLNKSNEIEKLWQLNEYSGIKIELYHNQLFYYNGSRTVFWYDFNISEPVRVVTDCTTYYDEGIFKAKWEPRKTDFIVIGEWIYYMKGSQNLFKGESSYAPLHIYRANVNIPDKSVDTGIVLKRKY